MGGLNVQCRLQDQTLKAGRVAADQGDDLAPKRLASVGVDDEVDTTDPSGQLRLRLSAQGVARRALQDAFRVSFGAPNRRQNGCDRSPRQPFTGRKSDSVAAHWMGISFCEIAPVTPPSGDHERENSRILPRNGAGGDHSVQSINTPDANCHRY
jgi:hypothetical protein